MSLATDWNRIVIIDDDILQSSSDLWKFKKKTQNSFVKFDES